MTSRGSLQSMGCGSPKRAVVVGWGWGLMRENSQQVTPSLYLGVLSQRLDLPLPGWQRGALAHKSRGRPSGSRPATQKGACRATLLCVPKPHLLPRQCPLLAPDPPTPTPCCSPRWEEGLAGPAQSARDRSAGGPELPHPTNTHQQPTSHRR